MPEICHHPSLMNHPCFNAGASAMWGRIHLPIAPNCNIQCNFCNRLYDCVNENRPGVTCHVYTPTEALSVLQQHLQHRSDISVVGIAGPGDPLCDAGRTLETLAAVHQQYPELMLCVSTNGLNLPDHVDDLIAVGVTHITVTVNAVDPEIARKVYSFVRLQDQTYTGLEGAKLLLERQAKGLQMLKDRPVIVKVNSVVIPGVNLEHIPAIARKASAWGVNLMNCMPLIPVEGTPFAQVPPPDRETIHKLRKACGISVPQMGHCGRCRADAVGLLHDGPGQTQPALS